MDLWIPTCKKESCLSHYWLICRFICERHSKDTYFISLTIQFTLHDKSHLCLEKCSPAAPCIKKFTCATVLNLLLCIYKACNLIWSAALPQVHELCSSHRPAALHSLHVQCGVQKESGKLNCCYVINPRSPSIIRVRKLDESGNVMCDVIQWKPPIIRHWWILSSLLVTCWCF